MRDNWPALHSARRREQRPPASQIGASRLAAVYGQCDKPKREPLLRQTLQKTKATALAPFQSPVSRSDCCWTRFSGADPPMGDLNCDGATDAFDIEPFLPAITDPGGIRRRVSGCSMLADTSPDGQVDAFDIEPFIELLVRS